MGSRAGTNGWESNNVRISNYIPGVEANLCIVTRYLMLRLTFAVGPSEIKSFRIVERHYFKNKLVRSYDFCFGFCIPKSINNWETVYDMPELDEETRDQLKNGTERTVSDSFYFVDGLMVLHNKAYYSYV